ncbi:uncharacterized protein STEHIDRAFT_159183 [Stereum hirsutum FP-91666 SS1]|uniref:uncharacterized protein n=1 Tax=Stereum hirsutum (strain FP-91666) TaxID=721885 RepID=UPI00044495AB|nr:uncharacterized protein STEHIDRAFT_159183 [Stereum hirsutum FP-91666 SS1]EIM84512.1 hypothetical protein STEHIDRAFT_159183 [Stereum hirsutum FP-91666 SS1]
MSSLYSLFWDAGDWYYTYTRDASSEDFSADSSMIFGRCPQDLASTVSSSTQSSSQPASSTSSVAPPSTTTSATPPAASDSRLQGGPIAGIALGSTTFLLLFIGGLYCVYRRSRRSLVSPGPAPGITPFIYEEASSFGAESIQAGAGRRPISGSVGESNGRRTTGDFSNIGSSSTHSGQGRHITPENHAGTSSILTSEGHTVEENAGLLTNIGFSERSHGRRPLPSQPSTRPPPSYHTAPSSYVS